MGNDLDTVMGLSMVMKIRIGDKEMVMERSMVLGIRKGKENFTEHQVPKAIPIIPTIETGNLLSLHHQGGTGGGQRGDDGSGGDKGNGDREEYRNTNYELGDEDEEESDTEDSFELEITPQQLSQVTPGGGVLKITLSKRKPLRITTKAPSGEPDLSQTTVKTVYDPKKEKGDRTERGTINNAQTGLEQYRREEASPIGGKEPLQEDKNGKFNRPPGRQGGLDDKGSKRNGNCNEKPHGNGGSGGNGDPNEGGGPSENGEPLRKGGEEPPRRNGKLGRGDGGSDPSDDDGGGDGSSSPSSDTTPPRRRRHRRPRYVCVV